MLTPDATCRTSLAQSDDPIAAAEEDIRRYLFAHHIVPLARARRARGNPLIVLLGIYTILGVITALGAFWLNRTQCDPMIMDRGFTAACRDWSRDLSKVSGSNSASRWFLPDSLAQNF